MTFNSYGDKDVYTHKLESIQGADIHYWYGTKEAFVAKPQARHLSALQPDTHVEVFPGMNHGQFLIDHPEEVAGRINQFFRPPALPPKGILSVLPHSP